MAATVQPVKKEACHQMAGMSACHQQKNKEQQKDCANEGCTMLFSCQLCGFLIVESTSISPVFLPYPVKPVSLYKIGHLSAYHASNWKPPKAC